MSENTQRKSLPTDKFLTVAVNLIHKALIEPSRTEAKSLYRDLEERKTVSLTNLRMEDGSMVRFDLSLSSEHYQGRLNFTSFRAGLTMLLSSIAEAIKKPESLKTFASEASDNSVMFGITALTSEEGKPSVLVLGADSGRGGPNVELQLMYLDPSQFEQTAKLESGSASG
ncbi:hypothetical protein [Congregibacter sp.]|jgi:hypothetical protein|uniref:hypothetical protein n=1 Tax=Congregibacter sp. TaxID=2744308 RepID=UPI0039E2F7E2